MRDVPAGATLPAVVITGASEGIGLALARRFVGKGHNVVLVARGEERLTDAVDRLRDLARSDRVIVGVALDVARADAFTDLADKLAVNGLHLDVLINNAGIGLGGAFDEHPVKDIDALLALNIAALTRLMHGAIADMRRHGRGHIINMASLGGYVPGPYQAAYYATKAYVLSLSEAVAHELKGSGIRVAVVAPGPVDTDFHEQMGADSARYRLLLPSHSPEQVAASVYRGYRLGLRVIVPGIINRAMGLVVRIMPHPIAVPMMSFLLKPRPARANPKRRE